MKTTGWPGWVLMAMLTTSGVSAQETAPLKLFNGHNLDGWTGDPSLWTVQDGILVGRTTDAEPIERNTFLIYQGDVPKDFVLEVTCRVLGKNNSGIQYRSKVANPAKWVVTGYQADIHPNPPYLGMLYEEGGRGIVAQRGQHVTLAEDGSKQVTRTTTPVEPIDPTTWNTFRITAKGNILRHEVNGKVAVEVTDEDPAKRAMDGVIALQLHRGPAMTVEVKSVTLQGFDEPEAAAQATPAPESLKLLGALYRLPEDEVLFASVLSRDNPGDTIHR